MTAEAKAGVLVVATMDTKEVETGSVADGLREQGPGGRTGQDWTCQPKSGKIDTIVPHLDPDRFMTAGNPLGPGRAEPNRPTGGAHARSDQEKP